MLDVEKKPVVNVGAVVMEAVDAKQCSMRFSRTPRLRQLVLSRQNPLISIAPSDLNTNACLEESS